MLVSEFASLLRVILKKVGYEFRTYCMRVIFPNRLILAVIILIVSGQAWRRWILSSRELCRTFIDYFFFSYRIYF
jgi:hypothetical protein